MPITTFPAREVKKGRQARPTNCSVLLSIVREADVSKDAPSCQVETEHGVDASVSWHTKGKLKHVRIQAERGKKTVTLELPLRHWKALKKVENETVPTQYQRYCKIINSINR